MLNKRVNVSMCLPEKLLEERFPESCFTERFT